MTNFICEKCPLGSNGINGRWCTSLGVNVEHVAVPPCRPAEQAGETSSKIKHNYTDER